MNKLNAWQITALIIALLGSIGSIFVSDSFAMFIACIIVIYLVCLIIYGLGTLIEQNDIIIKLMNKNAD